MAMRHGNGLPVGLPDPHKLVKRQRASTTTTTTRRAAATNTRATAAAASTTAGTGFAAGAAYTGTNTRIAATAPPTGRTLLTAATYSYTFANAGSLSRNAVAASVTSGTFIPPSASATVAVNNPKASTASTESAENAGAKPILSTGALIGIIAGAAALGVVILAMLGWWCWKKRKAKKAEAAWWPLDASNGGGGGKSSGKSRPMGNEDAQPWTKGAAADIGMTRLGSSAGGGAMGEKSQSFNTAYSSQYGRELPRDPFADDAGDKARAHQQARDLLFANSTSSPSIRAESVNDVITFGGGSQVGRSSYATSAYPSERGGSMPPPRSALAPTPQMPPSRPLRPSQLATSASSPDPFSSPDDVPLSDRAKKRQSIKPPPRDLVLNISAARGYSDEALPPSPATPVNPSASPAASASGNVPPRRTASTNKPARSPSSALPYTQARRDELNTTTRTVVDAFPTPPRSPGRQEPVEMTSNAFGRVDSKPLRELENILDSFSQQRNQDVLPPIPDNDSSRALSVSSNATSNPSAAPNTASMQQNRSAGAALPASASNSSFPPSFPTSSSSGSLSPFANSVGASQYELNHPMSIYSSRGDIGEVPSSQSGSPTKSLKATRAGHPQGRATSSPIKAPTVSTPTIIRSDSRGNQHQYFDLSADERSDIGSRNSLISSQSAEPGTTQIVRKISLQRTQAPVRLNRKESLRHQEQARQPVPIEPLSSSPTSSAASSPRTPRDFEFGPAPTGKGGARAPPVQVVGNDFVPLSQMTLDAASQSYRSTTESFYGLYDDDLPAELQALSNNNPRVSPQPV